MKHPQAIVDSEQIGPGTKVWAFAHILPGAVIGADCNSLKLYKYLKSSKCHFADEELGNG